MCLFGIEPAWVAAAKESHQVSLLDGETTAIPPEAVASPVMSITASGDVEATMDGLGAAGLWEEIVMGSCEK
jgi:hypothetical protein